MSTFKAIELADYQQLKKYLERGEQQACDYNVGNLIAWAKHYGTQYKIHENTLFIRYRVGEHYAFAFPIIAQLGVDSEAAERSLKNAFEHLYELCRLEGLSFRMGVVEPAMFAQLEKIYPGRYAIDYSRDHADYVYAMEKLRDLSGKKLHGKKNHLNAFFKTYTDWSYEPISAENQFESLAMAKEWCLRNGCGADEEKSKEYCALKFSLKNWAALAMQGGVLRVDGQIIALTLGEVVNADTFSVHFEKAFTEYRGAYQAINQQFVSHALTDFKYINREEDTGDEGLRKAKESYRPLYMVEKGVLREL